MIARLLSALLGLALVASACTSDLTGDPNGWPCDAQKQCLDGYVCDQNSRCLRVDLHCKNGETICGDACVTLSTDPDNCGTCGTHPGPPGSFDCNSHLGISWPSER